MRNPLLGLRVEQELIDRLDVLAEVVPGGSRQNIARHCLEQGIKALEADPKYAADVKIKTATMKAAQSKAKK